MTRVMLTLMSVVNSASASAVTTVSADLPASLVTVTRCFDPGSTRYVPSVGAAERRTHLAVISDRD